MAKPTYLLTLVDKDGIVLDTWDVSGGLDGYDLSKPLARGVVLDEIVEEIERDRKRKADVETLPAPPPTSEIY